MLKIGLLTDNYPDADPLAPPGGIGTYTKLVAEELARLGHEVHVFVMAAVPRLEMRELRGVRVWLCPIWSKRRDMGLKQAVEFTLSFKRDANLLHAYALMTGVRQAARTARFDVIESPEAGAYGYLARRFARRYAVRAHSATSPTSHLLEAQGPWTAMSDLEQANLRAADIVTAPTAHAAECVDARWKCNCNAVVIGNPIADPGAYMPLGSDARPEAVFFGRLIYQKGVDVFAGAVGAVRRQFKDFRATVIGPDLKWPNGMYASEYLPKITRDTGGGDALTVLPAMSHDALRQKVREYQVCVLPSRHETFGLVVLEALSWGMPTVVSDIPPFQELVRHEQDVLTARVEDSEDLAKNIIRLLANPVLGAELARRGAERALQWDVAHIVPRLLAAWTGAPGQAAAPGVLVESGATRQ